MAQVGVAQKQMKDVKQILLSYLACRQIWLNYSYRLSSLWLRHKITKNILGPPLSRKAKKEFSFLKSLSYFFTLLATGSV
jgi:hypothetical protein